MGQLYAETDAQLKAKRCPAAEVEKNNNLINKDNAISASGQLGITKSIGGDGSKTSTTKMHSPEAEVEKNKKIGRLINKSLNKNNKAISASGLGTRASRSGDVVKQQHL